MRSYLFPKNVILESLGKASRNALQANLVYTLLRPFKQSDLILAESKDIKPVIIQYRQKRFEVKAVCSDQQFLETEWKAVVSKQF
jgi:hypothetical protein